MSFVGHAEDALNVLEDGTRIFVGRKKSIHQKYGDEGTLLLGKCVEHGEYGKFIYLDAISPHVIFATGSRGTGKSYTLACIAEELTIKNPNVASVIIDPIGIFWSMKYPNKNDKEIEKLGEWGLEPKGIRKTQVFIPEGMKKKIPKDTYDRLFSLRPGELTTDDWCLTFGLERFGPTALLLEKAIEIARKKYNNDYSIDDLVNIVHSDPQLTSKEKGFKADSRRAVISRLEAAKTWGILCKDATDLSEVCKEGYVSIIDISFLEENVASLVIGMLAKKILNARKLVARQSSMNKHMAGDLDELLNVEIPPTWLFIDEAHTLIPGGANKTAATDALIEYVKQGRRPGCSLVFATQQPSAIDSKVLSQLDLVLCHKLVFDTDLKAVMQRMPTMMPKEYEKNRFLKTLPVGIALMGDRSELTSRAFCIQIRPRYSQHEGRESTSAEFDKQVDPEKLKQLVVNLIYKKLEERGSMKLFKVEETTDTVKRRYNVYVDPSEVLDILVNEKACHTDDEKIWLRKEEGKVEEPEQEIAEKIFAKDKEIEEDGEKVIALGVTKDKIAKIAEKHRKKKLLFLGTEENIKDIDLKYEQLYKINYNVVLKEGYRPATVFVDQDYEILYNKKGFKKTKDVSEILEMSQNEVKIINALQKTRDWKKLQKITGMTPQGLGRVMRSLEEKNLVKEGKEKKFKLLKKLDIPGTIVKSEFNIENKLKLGKLTGKKEKPYAVEGVLRKIPTLFEKAKVKNLEVYWKPVYYITYKDTKGNERIEKVDGI